MSEAPRLNNSIKATRTRLGLSQQDLASAAGIARQTVGGMEAGLYAPSAAVALRLARALGCTVEELFWLDEDAETVEATLAKPVNEQPGLRVTLAQIEGKWIAHPLMGEQAFRSEMVPADGVGAWKGAETSFSVRLLDEPEALARTVVLAGCTPALSLWALSAERWYPGLRVHWHHANSTEALLALARGDVHVAGVHLADIETGEDNAPFVRSMLGNTPFTLVNLGRWTEGLLVAPGNPKGIQYAGDITRHDIRLVNREVGAGARLLLDSWLRQAGVSASDIAGYESCASGHLEVARAVRDARVETGVSTEAVAAVFGLGFVPIRQVRYDLAVRTASLEFPPLQQLLGTLHHRWIRLQLNVLGGYDTSLTGDIVAQGEA